MAIHRTGQQIVLRSGSFPDSDSVSSQASRNEKISPNRDTPTNHGIPVFPAANSDEELYHQNVLLAVERWFSLFGWPSGPHPISIPHTLRRYAVLRLSQFFMDMLHHLTGTQIPGIPCCRNLSSDIDQRTKQLLQQHEAILAFLRVQGASLFHIKPEYLLDYDWETAKNCYTAVSLYEKKHDLAYRSVDYESLSKRSWTDVLLQIYKVLVLRRVSEKSPKTILNQQKEAVNSQPLASNIYSAWELQLLSWLNTHYQSMRETIWDAGSIPSARWIVNFDLDLTDGLVLAALLAAYCPYLIHSHFRRMYTTTSSLEQILHNNIVVVQALTDLSLNIDIQVNIKLKLTKLKSDTGNRNEFELSYRRKT
uniref:Calponin-homology (CH) domain-containing protein n=1 Tax=Anabas testudineus TaxID=64144 RepID=A0A3Q1I3K5_ANATE